MGPEAEPHDSGIKSWAREKTDKAAWFVARSVNHVFPNLTANQLTLVGGGTYIAGVAHSVAVHLDPESDWRDHLAPFGVKVAGAAMDGLDGKLADLTGTKDVGNGMNLDGGTDRIEYLMSGIGRLIEARCRGSKYGQIAAIAATVAGQLPSVTRARIGAELGIEPNEGGRSKVDIIGTHAGRMPLVTIAQDFPEIAGVPVQEIVDTAVTAASLKVVGQRLAYYGDPQPRPNDRILDDNERLQAASRHELYNKLLYVSIAAMAGTYFLLNHTGTDSWWNSKVQDLLKMPIVK